jgi:hypothetical protein
LLGNFNGKIEFTDTDFQKLEENKKALNELEQFEKL